MNNNDKIENTLRSAVSNAVPDVLGGIMDACDQQKGKVIYMEKKKNNTLRSVAAIAAVFVLLIAGIFLAKNFQGGSSGTLAAVVSFDVNPSIELSVDKNEKVLSAAGLNDDGREVLDGMELKDTDLDVAVNAIVGSMLQHGYLDDMANSILLSVSGVDGYDADTLQAKLTESVNKLLKDCSVLSQNVSDADSDLVEKADKYGITVGKAKLITEIVASDSRHNFEELVGLTINELNLIAGGKQLPNISAQGQASEKSYIGNDAALSAALTHADLSRDAVQAIEIELDYEYGRMVYEVEFNSGRAEYEYDIDARSGEVIWFEIDNGGNIQQGGSAVGSGSTQSGSSTDVVGAEKAKSAALGHAGLTAAQVSRLHAELDREGGRYVYEVEFKYGGYEYSYDIDAANGAVLTFDKELDD